MKNTTEMKPGPENPAGTLTARFVSRIRRPLWLIVIFGLTWFVWGQYARELVPAVTPDLKFRYPEFFLSLVVMVATIAPSLLAAGGFLLAAYLAGPFYLTNPERPVGRKLWWEFTVIPWLVVQIVWLAGLLVVLPILTVHETARQIVYWTLRLQAKIVRMVSKRVWTNDWETARWPTRPFAASRAGACRDMTVRAWKEIVALVKSLCRVTVLLFAVVILMSACLLPAVKDHFIADFIGKLDSVIEYDPVIATRVYSADGQQICTFANEGRIPVEVAKVPEHVRQAFIAAEDQYFYGHRGIDLIAMVRAVLKNRAVGKTKQGASTLTQQVIKQVVLEDNSKSYERKIREILLAVELERRLTAKYGRTKTKDIILQVYLNHVYLGHETYGIQAAARGYFAKDVDQLTLAEAATLAGLPKAPSNDSPYNNPRRAKVRQSYVLDMMVEQRFIDAETAKRTAGEPIAIIERSDPLNRTAAPYFCEHVRKELKRMYGNEAIFDEGLTVHTTLDMKTQQAAQAAVRLGLLDLERRLGFTGPEGHEDAFTGPESCDEPRQVDDEVLEIGNFVRFRDGVKACVGGRLYPLDPADELRIVEWETKTKVELRTGDLMSMRLETRVLGDAKDKKVRYALTAKRTAGPKHPEALQAALVAVDPKTGYVRAMVGGYDYAENQYNTATMSRRQLGSSVKPYVYLNALMNGATVDKQVNDHSVTYLTASGYWSPKNYGNRYYGTMPLRDLLARSANSVSAQLLAEYGGPDATIRTMRRLGITSKVDRVMPISVGAVELTLLEHTYAYATIASGGLEMPRMPDSESQGIFITKVTGRRGDVLYEYHRTEPRQVIPADDAYSLIYLMRGVVEDSSGTGHRVMELSRPAGGKTGTTNDNRDVWFMGYTTDLVVGTWVGTMSPQKIAEKATGGAIALPIWLAFMKAAHPQTPAREFPVPPDASLMLDDRGKPIPFQRGRMPEKWLVPKPQKGFYEDP